MLYKQQLLIKSCRAITQWAIRHKSSYLHIIHDNAYITDMTSHPAGLSNEERSSIYIANKDKDNIPPCRNSLLLLR